MGDAATGAPRIRRARGYRLYGFDGRRYLDLHQDGGRAILGHRGAPAVAAMKNALSEGLDSCLPSLYETRMLKALARTFPGCRDFRLFASEARALGAVSRLFGAALSPADLFDPAADPPPPRQPRAARWRPWLPAEAAAPLDRAEVFLPVLPVAVGEAPAVVCFRAGLPDGFPGSDALPGFLLAGAVRGLEALAAGSPAGPEPVQRALDGSRSWQRRGMYVRPLFEAGAYGDVHRHFLREGVLLSPAFPGPSILPAECSPGEVALLSDLFQRVPGG